MRINGIPVYCSNIIVLCISIMGSPSVRGSVVAVLKDRMPSHHLSSVPVETKAQTADNKMADYHIRRFFFPEDENRFAIILVTVDPKHFNRPEMSSLASHLKSEFAQIKKLRAFLFDDDNLVRLFVNGALESPEFEKAIRGTYELDRIKCKEYIEFSSQKGKPRNEVKIRGSLIFAGDTTRYRCG